MNRILPIRIENTFTRTSIGSTKKEETALFETCNAMQSNHCHSAWVLMNLYWCMHTYPAFFLYCSELLCIQESFVCCFRHNVQHRSWRVVIAYVLTLIPEQGQINTVQSLSTQSYTAVEFLPGLLRYTTSIHWVDWDLIRQVNCTHWVHYLQCHKKHFYSRHQYPQL